MDSADFSAGKSPRKELQGPRPTPLKVRKDSYKIRKPPPAPAPPQLPPRAPVIIYTVSPKIIHTNPSEFMTLVQRLTGLSSLTCSSSSEALADNNGGISPAERYASMEKIRSPEGEKENGAVGFMEGIEMGDGLVERTNLFPGILSPAPASLQPIPANFFSPPPSDPNSISFFHDLSPVLHGNRNFMEGSFMPSPSSSFFSPHIISPTPSIDLFNNFSDFLS